MKVKFKCPNCNKEHSITSGTKEKKCSRCGILTKIKGRTYDVPKEMETICVRCDFKFFTKTGPPNVRDCPNCGKKTTIISLSGKFGIEVTATQCPKCKDIIFSRVRHDYRSCSCGEVSIDGGFDYLKLTFSKDVSNLPIVRLWLNGVSKEQIVRDWIFHREEMGVFKEGNLGETVEIICACEKE
jgi:DNA-directed RNA polymerase subunit RPC12/RpoP